MGDLATGAVARQLEALFLGGSAAGLTDRQLLERFNGRRDAVAEAAFAALVARHGPMVLGVCRQLLGDQHHAEDAFQAVFLVLARRAGSVRDPDRLGNWLYGVALRTSRCARLRLARRRRAEAAITPAEPTAPPADQAAEARDQAEALHREIERLPESFRLPVVLCYLEGLTVHEAADQLRWSHGTVRSRMARAREKLHRALTVRGAALPMAALEARSGSLSSLLTDSTARAATRFAAGTAVDEAFSASTTALAREVLRTMMIQKTRLVAMMLLFAGALAAGAGSLIPSLPALARSRPDEPRSKAAGVVPPPPDPDKPAPGRMFVVGRVLGPDGKPVPGASIGVMMRRKLLFAGMNSEGVYPLPSGRGASDAEGRFRVDAPRTSSADHEKFFATATAPGYGLGWADLDPDDDRPSADIALQPEQPIEGRLFDVQGQPVAGAVVSVWSIHRQVPGPGAVTMQGRVIPTVEGPALWRGRVHDEPGWPKPARSDADGRFTLLGIGRGLRAGLSIHDPRFAPQVIGGADASRAVKAALLPARTLNGRVTYADTGRPVARARVEVRGAPNPTLAAETDADGRFRVGAMAVDRVNVAAHAPDGEPYFIAVKALPWPKGATEQAVDLALSRGLLLRGKVTKEGTGRPVADAWVKFGTYRPQGAREEGSGAALTKPDGSFAFAVGRHPGHLSVQAPGEDYQLQVIGSERFYNGKGGGSRLYAHAFLPYDPGQGAEPPEVNVALRPCASVTFRLIGPDGQPADDVRVYSRAVLGPSAVSVVRTWLTGMLTIGEVARHGRFKVHGLDETTEVPVHFLQPGRRLGATARVSGKMAKDGPITVRLEPCGVAMARLVGPDGRPVTGQPGRVVATLAVTPGPPRSSPLVRGGALAADEAGLNRLDPTNHRDGLIADARGRITLPALIPGATYRILDQTALVANDDDAGSQVRREFVVETGQAVELGDVLVQKPPR